MEELWDDYLQYLLWACGLQKQTRYSELFMFLHNVEFTYLLRRDQNREEDGLYLREDFIPPEEYSENNLNMFGAHWCSVLEVLIALALRVDREYIGDPSEPHPERFLMEMLKNLGLTRFQDGRFVQSGAAKVLQRWMDRVFERDGRGSPFPVKHDPRDQRRLEISDQMISYINENYD